MLRSIELGAAAHDWRNTVHSLALAAAVFAGRGDLHEAVIALAGGAKLTEEIGAALESAERAVFERTREEVRAALGEERFTDLWAEGNAMDRDAVLPRVLDDLAEPSEGPRRPS